MDGGFFERYGSGLKETFEEDTIIAENDKLATLTEKETSNVFKETALKTQLSYTELLSSLLELNVCIFYWHSVPNDLLVIILMVKSRN